MKNNTTLSLFLLASLSLVSYENQANSPSELLLWQETAARNNAAETTYTTRSLKLNEAALGTLINRSVTANNPTLTISLPLPDGRNVGVLLHQELILSPELQPINPTAMMATKTTLYIY